MKVFVLLSIWVAICGAATIRIELPHIDSCDPPACKVNETVHFPHWDPYRFWQCAPDQGGNCEDGAWSPVEKLCPAGLYFNYAEQACGWDCDWDNVCGVDPPPPTTTTEGNEGIENPEVPDIEDCDNIQCSNTTILYPHPDKTKFIQCRPGQGAECEEGGWVPEEMDCPEGLIFHYWIQVCDWPCEDWVDPCEGTTPTKSTPTEPTPTPTDPTPTPTDSTPTPTDSTPTPTDSTPTPTDSTPTPTDSTTTTEGAGEVTGEEPGDCEEPFCSNTTRLYPHKNPHKYWQCRPGQGGECEEGGWIAQEMDCPPGLWFWWKNQTCSWECDWDNVCEVETPTPTLPTKPTPTPSRITRSTTSRTTRTTTTTTPEPTDPTTDPITSQGGEETFPPPDDCDEPVCSNTTRLYPHVNPHKYWQCRPGQGAECEEGGWIAQEMDCPPGLWFWYANQTCSWECDWDNVCEVEKPDPTTPKPTTKPTTRTTRPTPTRPTPTPTETTDGVTSQGGEETPPPPEHCDEPQCYNTTRLFPHHDDNKFWQCVPGQGAECEEGGWIGKIMHCPENLIFHYWKQVCDWPCEEWVDPCP